MRAACERSKGGGCRSPRKEGGRRLPFTAGLARFFALALGKEMVAIERNETMPEAVTEQYVDAKKASGIYVDIPAQTVHPIPV